jgi:CDP-4-dehydro-6-deoxyglucose reductase, E3
VAKINFEGRALDMVAGQTVLERLELEGLQVTSFCRSGVCQSCVLRTTSGNLPAIAQAGLKETWKRQGYFLSCVCKPDVDLDVSRCEEGAAHPTRIVEVSTLAPQVLRVVLERPPEFAFAAGQFIQLLRPTDGLMRPYSIASVPDSGTLELHVALLANGQMSGWLAGAQGQAAEVRGPFGECIYLPDELDRPLLLAGTGTGLAPLLGVLRTAMAAGHRGPIRLMHGAVHSTGLYYWQQLCRLQAQMPQLSLVGSVLQPDVEDVAESGPREIVQASILRAPLDEVVMSSQVAWAEQRVYLCGHPDLVRTLRKKVFLAGTPLQRIHADPFLPPKAAA